MTSFTIAEARAVLLRAKVLRACARASSGVRIHFLAHFGEFFSPSQHASKAFGFFMVHASGTGANARITAHSTVEAFTIGLGAVVAWTSACGPLGSKSRSTLLLGIRSWLNMLRLRATHLVVPEVKDLKDGHLLLIGRRGDFLFTPR